MRRAWLSLLVIVVASVALPSSGARTQSPPSCSGGLVSHSSFYATCPNGTFVTHDGRSWQRVFASGPISFRLDRRHAWRTTNDCARGRASLHRTSDGGRTWHSTQIRAVNCSAGSYHQVVFVDQRNGWLVVVFGNAYIVDLYRTRDGGRTWRFVRGELPLKGTVNFETPRVGWLAHSDFTVTQGLYVTRDGGRTWRRRVFPPPPGWEGARMFTGMPTFFGTRGVVPVSLAHSHRSAVAFYATADGGRSWRLRSVRRVVRPILASPHALFVRYVPTAVAAPDEWWVVAGRFLRTIHVTTDAGRRWRVERPQGLPGSVRASISALDPRHAWLTAVNSSYDSVLYATTDGGRSWRQLAPR